MPDCRLRYLGKKVGWQALSAGLEEMGGAGGKDWSGELGRGQKVDELSLVPSLAFTRSKGTSLVMHWLRLCAPNAEDVGLIPVRELRSHMLYSN